MRERSDPIAWLEAALKIDYPSPEIMRVALAADDAEETAELLNAVAAGLVKVNRNQDEVARQNLIEELGKKKREIESDLSAKRAQFDARSKAHDEKARDEAYKMAQEVVKDAKKTFRAKEIELEIAREELKGIKTRIANIDSLPVPTSKLDEYLRTDTEGGGHFLQLQKIQSDIIETKRVSRFANTKPLEDQRDSILKAIADLRERRRPELQARYREAELSRLTVQLFDQEQKIALDERLCDAFDKEVSKAEKAALKLAPSSMPMPPELKNLQDNIESLKGVRDTVAKTIALMEAEPYRPRVQLQSSAATPTGKDFSRQVKFAGAGAFGFFILLLFGVTWLEFRAQKIGEAEDLAQCGINLVGAIPNLPLSARQAVAGGASPQDALLQGQLSESVDSIRTLLLHVSRTDSLRVLMVTSANSGEGKTSLASQLAASLARAWRKTLLIDGDLRHPAGHDLFGLPLEPGLSEVLRNEVKPADAIKPTPLSRLWMLPAGHVDTHALQALAQDNVRTLLEQLKQEYDFIVIDSCPVLPVADSLILGQHVDGVVFSVLRDVSRLPALHAAYQKITNLGIRALGAVVIGAKSEGAAASYKYAAATV